MEFLFSLYEKYLADIFTVGKGKRNRRGEKFFAPTENCYCGLFCRFIFQNLLTSFSVSISSKLKLKLINSSFEIFEIFE